MSRPIKEGLYYFPFDIDFFDDPKVLFVENKYGEKGELIVVKLLSWIYRNGYYTKWNEEFSLLFAKRNFTSIKSTFINDVVSELLKRGFFNESIFKSFGILTSKGIQERWQRVIDKSKRKASIKSNYNLINSAETSPKQEETVVETEESTQSKIKERKGKYNKTNVVFNKLEYFNDDDFQEVWNDFMTVRTKKDAASSDRAMKSFVNKLVKYASTKEDAIKIVAKSADSGWPDIYPLDRNHNSTKKRVHVVSNEEYKNA